MFLIKRVLLALAFISFYFESQYSSQRESGFIHALEKQDGDMKNTSVENEQEYESSFVDIKIIGGRKATNPKYLFTVALQYKYLNRWDTHCGGSLIHPGWVLTAAHCVKIFDRLQGRVVFGSSNIKRIKRSSTRSIVKHIAHRAYRSGSLSYDIALLKLDVEVEDIPLVELNKVFNGDKENSGVLTKVTGFGLTKENANRFETQMRIVSVPIVSQEKCKNSYREVEEFNICAGYDKGKKDSCTGDSGGPLFIEDSLTGAITQIGVVSYGKGCARQNFYGVYSRVSYFSSWISETLWGESKATLPTFVEGDFDFCIRKKTKEVCNNRSSSRCYWNSYGKSQSKLRCLPAAKFTNKDISPVQNTSYTPPVPIG